jgi:hypothetical protein
LKENAAILRFIEITFSLLLQLIDGLEPATLGAGFDGEGLKTP